MDPRWVPARSPLFKKSVNSVEKWLNNFMDYGLVHGKLSNYIKWNRQWNSLLCLALCFFDHLLLRHLWLVPTVSNKGNDKITELLSYHNQVNLNQIWQNDITRPELLVRRWYRHFKRKGGLNLGFTARQISLFYCGVYLWWLNGICLL